MGLLDGKVAIVTGAGRGIGREEALLLASEGAKVIVNDVGASLQGEGGDVHPAQEVVDLIVANGGEAAVNGDDISTWEGGKNVIDQAVETFGDINILVNNAGILRDKMSFNMTESDWDDVIRVHLKGHFATAQHAAVYWRSKAKAGEDVYGRIINTSSEAGLFGNAGQANYSTAKAGIVGLTWTLARELSRIGVTVNAIAPGYVDTDMVRAVPAEVLEKIIARIPRGRLGTAADIARGVVFLTADEAVFITGSTVSINGGQHMY